ncbi:MAG TPA: beta-ketoacyl reductase, partial [Vicinamibacteria bacterium]
ADRGGLGGALARRLRERGDRCVLVASGPGYAERPDGPWQVDPSSPADFRRLIAGARAAGGAPPTRVVNQWPLDATAAEDAAAEDVHAAARLACAGLLHLAQAAAQEGAGPIWVVTRGAHAVDAGDPAPAVAQAPVWGLGRTVAVERPEIWGGLLDLAPRAAADDVDRVIAEVTRPDGEDQVAWRGGVRHAARIAPRGAAGSRAVRPRPDGAYLVTGGLGRLGLKVGAWLAENGAGRIVLTGRRGLPDRAEWPALPPGSDAARQAAAVQAIEARGATVEVAAVDVADAEAMTRLLDRCAAALPLRGIVHAAADLRTDALDEMTESALDAALRPKVAGAWVLHRWSAARELDFLVFFSSTTALFGSRYLAHYAAANAFLDALAHHRRARGLPGLSVNWGVWEDMREGGAEHRREFAGGGLRPMPSARALRALGQVAGGESAQVTVADVDWPALKAVYETKRRRPFLAEVGGAPAVRRAAPAGAPRADLAARLLAARADDRWDVLAEHVRGEVARVLRWPDARTIELQRGLFDLGLDSLMSVELKTRLEASLDRALPSTLTFNYPSVAALTDYLAREVLALAVEAPAAAQAAVAARDEDDLSEDELASRLAETLGELR